VITLWLVDSSTDTIQFGRNYMACEVGLCDDQISGVFCQNSERAQIPRGTFLLPGASFNLLRADSQTPYFVDTLKRSIVFEQVHIYEYCYSKSVFVNPLQSCMTSGQVPTVPTKGLRRLRLRTSEILTPAN
jgi:hypothetical protein